MDRRLERHDEDLAARAKLIAGLDARLVLIDPDSNTDKYYVLQGLEDDNGCYSYRRWGRTGTDGEAKIEGPTTVEEVEKILHKVFKDKTGKEWGSLKPGDRALPGKYWLQRDFIPNEKAKWQYYVHDNIDGKANDWYDYDANASEEVEELFAQHKANACEKRTATRVVASGKLGFSYLVDLEAMTQTNTRTRKARKIRRVTGAQALIRQSSGIVMKIMKKMKAAVAGRVAMKRAAVVKKSMKKTSRKPMKKVMKKLKKPMKKVSTIAKGKKAKVQVWRGKKVKTSTGLTKSDLVKSKSRKIVSAKKSELGKKSKWARATAKARAVKGYTGFKAIKRGTSFHVKATEIMKDL
jgi:predicted DNA-binding WGR domain protein